MKFISCAGPGTRPAHALPKKLNVPGRGPFKARDLRFCDLSNQKKRKKKKRNDVNVLSFFLSFFLLTSFLRDIKSSFVIPLRDLFSFESERGTTTKKKK